MIRSARTDRDRSEALTRSFTSIGWKEVTTYGPRESSGEVAGAPPFASFAPLREIGFLVWAAVLAKAQRRKGGAIYFSKTISRYYVDIF
jgi:hypothetical protein